MSITWRSDLSPHEWDSLLAISVGHPLQSALWGEARRRVEGVEHHLWCAFSGDELIMMRRVEVRRIMKVGKIAWLPRTSTGAHPVAEAAYREFSEILRSKGYILCFEDIYQNEADIRFYGDQLSPGSRTIKIDLSAGQEILFSRLDSQWRYGVRAADRAGVTIEQSRNIEDINIFFSLCSQISRKKVFDLPGSQALVTALLQGSFSDEVEARLFLARYEGQVAAGALVIRCGRSLHYFWGATDRSFSKQRPGEAVQWGVISWAIDHGITCYDLEGINPANYSGVSAFKRKMGGVEVDLLGTYAYPLAFSGSLALKIGRLLGRI